MTTEYLENLGTPSGLIATNVTGTASALIANTVTTNANLSGAITSVGNVTSLGSFTSAQLAAAITDETGTSKIVFSDSPQLAGIVNISNLTASTIMSADASKNVVSLALATYPSLTELSYVKGVTSGIQAQIAAIPVNPSQTGNADKVLATNGTASSWQYAGLGAGSLGTNNVILGRIKPAGLTGTANTLLGATAAPSITSGSTNIIVGTGSAPSLTTGQQNIIMGTATGLTTGVLNILIGHIGDTGFYCDPNASSNVQIGNSISTTGSDNIAMGWRANACGQSVALGSYAYAGTVGAYNNPRNVSVGYSSIIYSGSDTVSIGHSARVDYDRCVVIGAQAKAGAVDTVVIGKSSGSAACSGANNTVVGADSFNGASLTTAASNVIVGKGSGKVITTASENLILGVGSAPGLTTGSYSTYIGNLTDGFLATQSYSICVGYGAKAGDNSVSIGSSVPGAGGTVVGSYSVGIGAKVGGLSTDSESVRIGRLSSTPGGGFSGNIAGGSRSVCIGAYTSGALQATSYQNNDDCVYLGYAAGSWSMNKTNEFFLDNQSRSSYANQQTKSLLYGTFNATASSQTLTVNADLKPLAYTESVTVIGTVSTTSTISILSGTIQTATLTASTACTFTMPTATAGKSFKLYLKQAAATGLGTATFTGVKWTGAVAPTITATAGQMDILSFVADGTNWYGSYQQNYTP